MSRETQVKLLSRGSEDSVLRDPLRNPCTVTINTIYEYYTTDYNYNYWIRF